MFSIYENNKKISGACRSFVLCLDYVAISPFICFNDLLLIIWPFVAPKSTFWPKFPLSGCSFGAQRIMVSKWSLTGSLEETKYFFQMAGQKCYNSRTNFGR